MSQRSPRSRDFRFQFFYISRPRLLAVIHPVTTPIYIHWSSHALKSKINIEKNPEIMKISCCCLVLLLAVIPYLALAEDETTCPSAISSDCKCYENSESRLRIKCSETTLATVKSALIADSIHTDVWKL